ncbi:unnamed protein product [Hermetia illucens]|uniref:4'-phosphopantetheine phosphatase n=2 Tax=Hermetia illucens TaxID=343691 RepID=A0A7R8V3X9_HERIL|nr:unnamed protein product [Hermetia illucens]
MCEKTICPLLENPNGYNPDTLDLAKNPEARDYWHKCFVRLVDKFAQQAIASQENDPTAADRAKEFKQAYINKLNLLRETSGSPNGEKMTIRRMLELNDFLLRHYGFADPWLDQKVQENHASIAVFQTRLEELDALEHEAKWVELVKGLLAGNMFDYGAQAITEILKNDKSFGLKDALKQIQPRPWLVDQLDEWIERLKGPPHKCAVIFVDNSGIDIVLGVLPFVRELLIRRTKVLLCANTEPSLNDVTSKELEQILDRCQCNILQNARNNNQLLVYATGQSTPCLDLRTLSPELCMAMKTNETDLIVIEGMGRALHTNLYAKFSCETFKLAVVKNKWLAEHLGGELFSVICKYESI